MLQLCEETAPQAPALASAQSVGSLKRNLSELFQALHCESILAIPAIMTMENHS
jgi:hypothetical protein